MKQASHFNWSVSSVLPTSTILGSTVRAFLWGQYEKLPGAFQHCAAASKMTAAEMGWADPSSEGNGASLKEKATLKHHHLCPRNNRDPGTSELLLVLFLPPSQQNSRLANWPSAYDTRPITGKPGEELQGFIQIRSTDLPPCKTEGYPNETCSSRGTCYVPPRHLCMKQPQREGAKPLSPFLV